MKHRSEESRAGRTESPLRELRLRRGWTAEDLAARAGISGRTIYAAEAGHHQPHPATRRVLAQALGCDPAELIPPPIEDESLAGEARISSKSAGTGRDAYGAV